MLPLVICEKEKLNHRVLRDARMLERSTPYLVSIDGEVVKDSSFSQDAYQQHHGEEQEHCLNIDPADNFFHSRAVVKSRQKSNREA